MEVKPPSANADKEPGRVFYELGQSIHHIALYRRNDGTMFHLTETRLQATKNLRQYGSPIRKTLDDGSRVHMSLCPGDTIVHKDQHGVVKYLVVRKVNQAGRVFYKPSAQADVPKPEVSFGPGRFADGSLSKVSVDPIGRVRPARD
jgi:hypothetical protein